MKMIPLGDRVLIKRRQELQIRIGDLLVPLDGKNNLCTGIVEAIGSETKTHGMQSFDEVAFQGDSELEFEVDGETFVLVKASDLKCFVIIIDK